MLLCQALKAPLKFPASLHDKVSPFRGWEGGRFGGRQGASKRVVSEDGNQKRERDAGIVRSLGSCYKAGIRSMVGGTRSNKRLLNCFDFDGLKSITRQTVNMRAIQFGKAVRRKWPS